METSKKVILCVDDEKLVLISLKAQLKRGLGPDYIIESAESGEDALEIIDELQAENAEMPLIISDQIMPGMKGDDLLIMVHERLPRTLSIMLTGQANADAVGKALNQAKLYHYISKPWDETDLILTVSEAIRSFYLEKTIEEQKFELERLVHQLQDYNETLEQKVIERTKEIEIQKVEIESQRDSLEEMNAAKDKLFAVIGHDLRNSLSALISIIGTLNAQYSEMDEEDKQKSLQRIDHATHEMDRLLEHLLDWTRIQSGKVRHTPLDFDLCQVAEEMISYIKSAKEKKNIAIELGIQPRTKVHADRNMIGTIMRNLVTNAIKFSPQDSYVRIYGGKINSLPDEPLYQVVIEDNGIGIDPEKQVNIFNIGGSSSTPGTANEKGTGLGLLICKDMVEINGGTISVESQKGKGSKFIFTIPSAESE
jgi:two-component system, sensor histidine kinase and response regulator